MTTATTPIDAIRGLATVALWPDTGQLLGLSKNSTYQAAKRGEIPTIRIGARYIVPVQPLLRMLGALNEEDPSAEATPAGVETDLS